MFDNPRNSLRWMEEELLDPELEEILYSDQEEGYAEPSRRRKKKTKTKTGRAVSAMDDESRYVPRSRKKGLGIWGVLAVLELLGILAILGWWLQWLI